MKLGMVKKLLNLWANHDLISDQQKEEIFLFMKERRRIQLLRLIKWLFIIGAFWIFFGFIALVKMINPQILKNILDLLRQILRPLIAFFEYVYQTLEKYLGDNANFVLFAAVAFIVAGFFFWLGSRRRRQENLAGLKLDYFAESSLRSAMVFFVLGYIAIGAAFSFLNHLLLPADKYYYYSGAKVVPYFYFCAVAFYLFSAYRLKDQIALLFGIYFIGLSVGCFSGYTHACYWLGISRPVLQVFTAVILILVGFIHILAGKKEYQEYFGRTWQWTGLLMGFLALWTMSIWGMVQDVNSWHSPGAAELWFANILFISAALGSMGYGAKSEDALFFNYGLVFLIIATYTIFFSHLWATLGSAVGSLALGIMLVATGHMLRKIWLGKRAQT
ncbi:MAG: hypothetical protein AB1650_09815 [Candidatus Omnitrophota bacterium]